MMIKNTIASTAALVLSTGLAFSGTLSNAAASVPSPKWAGFYAGLNVGGIWSENTTTNILSSFVQGSQNSLSPNGAAYTGIQSAQGASGTVSTSNAGFIGGAQIGHNWQFTDRWIGGLEADFQGIASGQNNGQTSTFVPLVGVFDAGATVYTPGKFFESSLNVSKRTNYLGTIRGRLGRLATPTLLVHGTGGFAYGGVSSSASVTQTNNDSTTSTPEFSLTPQSFSTGRYSRTLLGWTVGADAEWMFMPNWSAKFEYLYYDLGRVSYGLSPTVITIPALAEPLAVVNSQASTRFNGNIIRVGVNHHFNL
jgi:outer membrane immunogenic protein